jgi:hypothetical protein
MAETRAEQYIRIYDLEWNKNGNFRNLWQETSELMFPRESNISQYHQRGAEQTKEVYDTTAVTDSKEMGDGLLSAIIPAGEYFFKWNVSKDNIGGQLDDYDDYLMRATDKQHRSLFSSNFMSQMSETMRSLICFGTGNIFSEWSIKAGGLNFKDYDIALYLMLMNSEGVIDTMMIKFPFTARQAVQEWGDKVGKKIQEAYDDPKKRESIFPILHIVRPRAERNPAYSEDPMNMPWESVYIDVKNKHLIDEGGFPEFPYHPCRWMVTTGEIFGRGIGTQILPQVRLINKINCDLVECGNKHNDPPKEVLESFEGEVQVFAGACNYVQEIGTIVPIQGVQGNFPISKDILEMKEEIVHKAFYKNVFNPITDLKGDRRTTVEIRERKLEGLRRVGQPVGRIQTELLEPMLRRTLMLLIRNGEIPRPPLGLETIEIEYLGLMANALSSGQAVAFQKALAIGIEMKESIPSILDNINIDEGFRNLCRQLGVRAEDINSIEDRDAIRAARQAELQKQQLMEAAQLAAQGYSQTTAAPEEGSAAGALMEAT